MELTPTPLVSGVVTGPEAILEARRLQAQVYLTVGYVDKLDPGGVIDDPWVDRSTYLAVFGSDERMLGVSRLIRADTVTDLPTLANFDIDDNYTSWLEELEPSQVVEVSALAVLPGVSFGRVAEALYAEMSVHAIVDGRLQYWVAALDERVLRYLMLRNDNVFEQIGAAREYLGSLTVPVRLDLYEQVRHWAMFVPDKLEVFLRGAEIDIRGESISVSLRSEG